MTAPRQSVLLLWTLFVIYVSCLSQLSSLVCVITWPRGYKTFLCSTRMSTKFQLLIKTKIPTDEEVYCFKSRKCCIYRANIVKMPTTVGILTFMSRINFVLSWVENGKSFITLGPARKGLTACLFRALFFVCRIHLVFGVR